MNSSSGVWAFRVGEGFGLYFISMPPWQPATELGMAAGLCGSPKRRCQAL